MPVGVGSLGRPLLAVVLLLLRPPPPANSMSSRLRVFSRTLTSVAVVADGADVRRPVVSFSLLLDTDEPDSVDAFRWSFVCDVDPVPLTMVLVDLALGLVAGEALRTATLAGAAATGERFLTGEAFLVGDACRRSGEEDDDIFLSASLPGCAQVSVAAVAAHRSLIRPGDSSAPPPLLLLLAAEGDFLATPLPATALFAAAFDLFCSARAGLLPPSCLPTPFIFLIRFGDCRLGTAAATVLALLLAFCLLFLFSLLVAASGFRPLPLVAALVAVGFLAVVVLGAA